MSFAGGGSDLASYYKSSERGGAVLSTAIDKYVYVCVNRKFDEGFRIAYSQTEEVERLEQIQHRIVREVLTMLGVHGGVEITSTADIPSKGTGLGSSSSFTVALLQALSAYLGKYVSADDLGKRACHVEIERCGEPIGKQDQFAAALGGLRFIEFLPDNSVVATPLIMQPDLKDLLERRILVFYTGMTRSTSSILATQSAATAKDGRTRATLDRMVDIAFLLRDELQSGHIDALGALLDESWRLKSTLSQGITTDAINDLYARGRGAGAHGGKLLGAGGGGFLMFYAPTERHDDICRAVGLRRVRFGFEPLGSRILFYNPSI